MHGLILCMLFCLGMAGIFIGLVLMVMPADESYRDDDERFWE